MRGKWSGDDWAPGGGIGAEKGRSGHRTGARKEWNLKHVAWLEDLSKQFA